MKLDKIKRMAAQLLNVGESKVWLNPNNTDDIKACMTKEDVREQIRKGTIAKRQMAEQSRGRSRRLHAKKKRGRKRGFGKRRGTYKARLQKKRSWMNGVRAQRTFLRELRAKKKVSSKQYSALYKLVKGGYFKGKRYIELHLKE